MFSDFKNIRFLSSYEKMSLCFLHTQFRRQRFHVKLIEYTVCKLIFKISTIQSIYGMNCLTSTMDLSAKIVHGLKP